MAICCGVEPTLIASTFVVAGLVSMSLLVSALITETVPLVRLTT
jgi:hypothetical protein